MIDPLEAILRKYVFVDLNQDDFKKYKTELDEVLSGLYAKHQSTVIQKTKHYFLTKPTIKIIEHVRGYLVRYEREQKWW